MNQPTTEPASLLDERLPSTSPSLGCTFLISLILLVAGSGICYGTSRSGEDQAWVMYTVGGAFAFFGALVLLSWIRQAAMRRTPRVIVEVSTQPWPPGQPAKVAVIQQGPANLTSLKARLDCFEEIKTLKKTTTSYTSSRYDISNKLIYSQPLIEATHLRIAHGDVWQEISEFTLPPDVLPSSVIGTRRIYWQLEVWGQGGMLGTFVQRYDVVVGSPTDTEEEDPADDEEVV